MASRTEANGTNRLIHFLDLNELGLEEVPESQRLTVKRDVADYLKNQTLRQISAGDSPVQGEGRFKILDPDYARAEKGGRRVSDLELEGELKDSLISEPSVGSFIKYGHEGNQVPKSDGHNQISGKAKAWARTSKHPKRRYIPDDGQKFDRGIVNGMKAIIEPFKRREVVQEDIDDDFFSSSTTSTSETPDSISTGSDLFSDDVIESLLEDAFERRGIF